MYVIGIDEPMAPLEFALQLNEENLHSEIVRQHVLLLASSKDHFIPFCLHREQLRRLTAAGSITDRVFTGGDHAENHCQIGNIGLALRVGQGEAVPELEGRFSLPLYSRRRGTPLPLPPGSALRRPLAQGAVRFSRGHQRAGQRPPRQENRHPFPRWYEPGAAGARAAPGA